MSPDEPRDAPVVAVVDDEEDIATYLSMALEDQGYRVISVTDAAEALPVLARARPDLICLDLLMPGQTGLSLYSTLTGHPQLETVPVVIMSGLAGPDELPTILARAGGLPEPACFIEKPVEIDQLLSVIRRLVGQPRG